MQKDPGLAGVQVVGDKNQQHILSTHAEGKLLAGQPEAGVLRSSKFQKAARKVVVTNEVCWLLKDMSNTAHV